MALLELGKGTVVEISRKSGLKRPTAYLVLDELKKRNLVSEQPEQGRTVYLAEDPSLLGKGLKSALKDFDEMLPFMRAKFNRGAKPKIRFYEGADVIRNIYINEIFPSKRIYFYGTDMGKFQETWPDLIPIWQEKFWPKKNKKGEIVLEIVGNKPKDIEYARKLMVNEVRILPKGKSFFGDSIIADNKMFINSSDNLFMVAIESEDQVKTYQTLFEMAWEVAIPVDKWKD